MYDSKVEGYVARHPSSADFVDYDPGDEETGREGALDHLARHGISGAEVEQVFRNSPVWMQNKKGRRANWRMLGRTSGGRYLDIKVFWDDDRGALLPITGMDASDADRRAYL